MLRRVRTVRPGIGHVRVLHCEAFLSSLFGLTTFQFTMLGNQRAFWARPPAEQKPCGTLDPHACISFIQDLLVQGMSRSRPPLLRLLNPAHAPETDDDATQHQDLSFDPIKAAIIRTNFLYVNVLALLQAASHDLKGRLLNSHLPMAKRHIQTQNQTFNCCMQMQNMRSKPLFAARHPNRRPHSMYTLVIWLSNDTQRPACPRVHEKPCRKELAWVCGGRCRNSCSQ